MAHLWHGLIVSGALLAQVGGGFLPVLHVYTTGTNATETIPAGAVNVIIECWAGGGSGGPGTGSGCGALPGGGGAAGGYSRTSLSVVNQGGKTFTYTVGPGGAPSGNPGTASSVVAGTVTGFTNMSCNPGGGGNYGAGATGGTASGGTQANTTGGSVAINTRGAAAGTMGTVAGDGSPYGGGGTGGLQGSGNNGIVGVTGACVFSYT